MKMAKALTSVIFLLLMASTIDSTILEGVTLRSMMQQWSVNFSTWRAGTEPCLGWENVTCDSIGHVVKLNVSNRGISGVVPMEIGDLEYLEVLDLSNAGSGGNVTGTIYENYTMNSLEGPLPDTLSKCTALKSINLTTILWNMSFPFVITTLRQLEEFRMSNANLSGSIPDEFFQLSELRQVYLGNNNLKASLKDFSRLTELTQLTVWGNDFNSTIPEELGSLTNLTYFNCHDCLLYGGLPDSFQNLKHLQNMTLNNNLLTGPIPYSWRALQNLPLLRLDNNYLSGAFPTWLFDLPSLKYLYLSKNLFDGPFPPLDHSGQFDLLRLNCNYMTGKTPPPPAITPFDFQIQWNCFSDASTGDLNRVITSCGYSHTTDCEGFYKSLSANNCPSCPKDQNFLSGAAGKSCICGYNASSQEKKGKGVFLWAVLAAGILLIVLVVIGISIFSLCRRTKHLSHVSSDVFDQKQHQQKAGSKEWTVPPGVRRFTLEELARITDDFSDSHLIGAGGFGKVFSGTLEDGMMVAIKRGATNLKTVQGLSEFRNEIALLSRLHHRHLVRLEGFCDDLGYQILVYEFMKRGNLRTHLSGKVNTTPLHWYKRLEIALGIAQGLEYLHSFADPPVIHRDVKPSNILLDGNMVAKLSDFGISRVSSAYVSHISTKPAGTAGYLDPSYFFKRQLTTASDVYAYGMVLLELITGQKAIDLRRDDECNLIDWVNLKYKAGGIEAILDPSIEYEYSKLIFTSLTDLALRCAAFDKNGRPSMKEVLSNLEMHMGIQPRCAKLVWKGEDNEIVVESEESPAHRGVYITYDSEYLDSNAPLMVDSSLLLSGPLSGSSGFLVPGV